MTVTRHEFPTGLRCADCRRTVPVGDPYGERAMTVDELIDFAPPGLRVPASTESVRLVCTACAGAA